MLERKSQMVFAHDHVFKVFNNRYFSLGQYTDNVWLRYLGFTDKLVVIARKEMVENVDVESTLNETTLENVFFRCFGKIGVINRLFTSDMKKVIRGNIKNADVVICRLPSFVGHLVFYEAKKLDKKILVEVVGCPYDSYRNYGSLLMKTLAPWEAVKMKRIMKKCDSAIYVTQHFLQNRYPCSGNSTGISDVNLLNIGVFALIKENVKVIKFSGSLSASYKGLSDLIKAIAILKSINVDLELHVLGEGDRDSYLSLCQHLGIYDSVKFFNPIKGGISVLEWLLDGDIYVQPSHTEGLPRALIEAMSVGLPCIGTSVGGIPELLSNDVLCRPKNPDDLAHKILRLVRSKEIRQKQSLMNIEKCKIYDSTLLENKRDIFIREQFFT